VHSPIPVCIHGAPRQKTHMRHPGTGIIGGGQPAIAAHPQHLSTRILLDPNQSAKPALRRSFRANRRSRNAQSCSRICTLFSLFARCGLDECSAGGASTKVRHRIVTWSDFHMRPSVPEMLASEAEASHVRTEVVTKLMRLCDSFPYRAVDLAAT
jgi:hypothetical protein